MITLKEFLEAIEFKITGGSEYQWECFGPNARYLDCQEQEGYGGAYSISAIFDSIDQTVYAVELWDYKRDREYRWTNPEYAKAYKKEAKKKDVDPTESLDGRNYIDLDVPSDILEKISAVVAGIEYDERVKVEVDFSDAELLQYMKLAHSMDLTFNELVEQALQSAIDDIKAKAKENEN